MRLGDWEVAVGQAGAERPSDAAAGALLIKVRVDALEVPGTQCTRPKAPQQRLRTCSGHTSSTLSSSSVRKCGSDTWSSLAGGGGNGKNRQAE